MERFFLDCGRSSTQLMRDSLGGTSVSSQRSLFETGRLAQRLWPILMLYACGSQTTPPVPPEGALFEFLACRGSQQAPNGELFRARITDSTAVRQADSRVGKGVGLIVLGHTNAGDGGFNQPWRWHFDPASVRFAQVAVETCDGCPSWVVAGADYCPWSTEVLRRIE